MTKAGEGILAGALDALAYIEGDESRGRAHKIINAKIDVKAIRKKIGLSQVKFADTYGLPLSTLKKWETNVTEPKGPTKAYLLVIAQKPNVVKDVLASAI